MDTGSEDNAGFRPEINIELNEINRKEKKMELSNAPVRGAGTGYRPVTPLDLQHMQTAIFNILFSAVMRAAERIADDCRNDFTVNEKDLRGEEYVKRLEDVASDGLENLLKPEENEAIAYAVVHMAMTRICPFESGQVYDQNALNAEILEMKQTTHRVAARLSNRKVKAQ